MANEEVLNQLFDFYWFEYEILTNKRKPSSQNQVLDIHQQESESESESESSPPLMKISQTPSFIVRSFSDQALSSKDLTILFNSDSSSPSPKSVLNLPKLETIFSGKEVGEAEAEAKNEESKSEGGKQRRLRRKGRGGSRSLSQLEFEELKGFMDLGFVFSDEDKDSSLGSIIPGLHRLGKIAGGEEENDEVGNGIVEEKSSRVSRPYLSEAWDVFDEMKEEDWKKKKQLSNWRITARGNTDLEIKDQLRFWAHSVASTVR